MRNFTEQLAANRQRIEEAAKYLKIAELETHRAQLEAETSRVDLWDDQNLARKTTTEYAAVNETLLLYKQLCAELDEVETLHELAREERNNQHSEEIAQAATELENKLDDIEKRSMFTGEHDESDAVCQIKSGEGGTDAQDWAEKLMRMYNRWAERQGYEVEITAVTEGTEAGLSSVEFILKGRHAYGHMQAEHGVHRLVRNSPFNNKGKRHTAFAAVQVAPFFEEMANKIEIDKKELRVDTYRASGNGGQHINVTDSAVRITHHPTGIVTSCQNDRSQHQNKDRALQMMAAKLLDHERKKHEAEIAGITGEQHNVGFGSQIRSYVMQPYQMVKDLRTGHETSQIEAVLNGKIDVFMTAWLRKTKTRNT